MSKYKYTNDDLVYILKVNHIMWYVWLVFWAVALGSLDQTWIILTTSGLVWNYVLGRHGSKQLRKSEVSPPAKMDSSHE